MTVTNKIKKSIRYNQMDCGKNIYHKCWIFGKKICWVTHPGKIGISALTVNLFWVFGK